MDIRQKVQAEANFALLNNYNKCNTFIDVAPRVGKTKIGIDFLKEIGIDTKYVLISIPSLTIKKSWEEEFKLWKLDFKGVIVHKVNLNKMDLSHFKLIILDEVHNISFNNYTALTKLKIPIIGLSGSISQKTKIELFTNLRMKCVYKYSKEQAIKDKIISDYNINLIPIELDKSNPYIEYKSKLHTEKEYYNILCEHYEHNKNRGHITKMKFAGIRARALYSFPSKINKVISLLPNYKRVLIFTQLKTVADKICDAYHGSSDDNLPDFMSGKINKLVTCKMLSMGITIPNLKEVIFHQIQSSEEDAIQKCLRAMNYDKKKKATITIVYYKDTVDENWALNAIKSFKIK